MSERLMTHWGDGTECCGKPHLPPKANPEQEWRAHDHGGLRHEHYVRIDKPEHDHR